MAYIYKTVNICPSAITVQMNGDVIEDVGFDGGCDGNLKALRRIVMGMTVKEVENYFSEITCEDKNTSCAAQLSIAVHRAYRLQCAGHMRRSIMKIELTNF
jgi:uncharacterized protein (TIGR03905 family)